MMDCISATELPKNNYMGSASNLVLSCGDICQNKLSPFLREIISWRVHIGFSADFKFATQRYGTPIYS